MAGSGRGSWRSPWGFILAAAGSAVGLGNIWKFPYITGENGGGLFVLIYLACIALVGVPIMMGEIVIGRAAQKQPIAAFRELQGGRTAWAGVGWLGVIAGFVILSYYVVVAGWSMDFALKSVVNFANPIEEQARLDGKKYRVATSLEEMRERVSKHLAAHNGRDELSLIRRQAPPSVWRGHDLFRAALAQAESKDEARSILLEDAELADQVHRAEQLIVEIEAAKARHLAEARSFVSTLPEREVRDRAETLERRSRIAKRVGSAFDSLASDGWTSFFWAALFMVLTILIVAAGISAGIERACKVLMPTLIGLIGVMVVYGAFQPGFGEALAFVFAPDAHKLKASGVLEALGHAFFTLSLGMGAMITYGSYQSQRGGVVAQSLWIALFDTVIALLACMMIFPITFSYGLEPGGGPGLVFKNMPLAFAEIGKGGMLLAILFFGLLVFAALTSAISLLEVVSSYFIDVHGWPRRRVAWLLGSSTLLFAIPVAWASDPDFAMWSWSPGYGQDYFTTVDYLASNWMLPLGGLFIAIYVGWIMPARIRKAQLADASALVFGGWLLLIRFIAPILVVIVLLQKVGILEIDEYF